MLTQAQVKRLRPGDKVIWITTRGLQRKGVVTDPHNDDEAVWISTGWSAPTILVNRRLLKKDRTKVKAEPRIEGWVFPGMVSVVRCNTDGMIFVREVRRKTK